jgi:hypothetical protein
LGASLFLLHIERALAMTFIQQLTSETRSAVSPLILAYLEGERGAREALVDLLKEQGVERPYAVLFFVKHAGFIYRTDESKEEARLHNALELERAEHWEEGCVDFHWYLDWEAEALCTPEGKLYRQWCCKATEMFTLASDFLGAIDLGPNEYSTEAKIIIRLIQAEMALNIYKEVTR